MKKDTNIAIKSYALNNESNIALKVVQKHKISDKTL